MRQFANPGGPPRLVLRVAAYTALTIGLTAGGLFLYVYRYAGERAKDDVRFHTRFVADTIVGDNLRPSDVARPVEGARRNALDRLFRREVLVGGVVRVKLYGPAGRVTYSTDHGVIGTRPTDEDPSAVFADGKPLVGVSHLNH